MILVVDDEPSIAHAMKAILELNGLSAVTAASCDEALAVVDENPPQLIFSDINMPHHSGLELLRLLRANPTTADIPVVLVSALARDRDVQNGLAAGAAGYITKPFNPPELLTAVAALVH
jgi:CheY-like chemotaxis protein